MKDLINDFNGFSFAGVEHTRHDADDRQDPWSKDVSFDMIRQWFVNGGFNSQVQQMSGKKDW